MPLPLLNRTGVVAPDELLRLFAATERRWAALAGEETDLDIGVAVTGAELPAGAGVNRMLDAAVPPGWSPARAVESADEFFRGLGLRCEGWSLNGAVPLERTAPLAERLLAEGWRAERSDVYFIARASLGDWREPGGLTILPARAALRQVQALLERAAPSPAKASAALLELDDSHWDALAALRDGAAVGYAGVLAVGDVGRVERVWVAPEMRGRQIGRTLLGRMLEIGVRARFRQVMLGCPPDNPAAARLCQRAGFVRVGEHVHYRRD